jgi:hypothetical protein
VCGALSFTRREVLLLTCALLGELLHDFPPETRRLREHIVQFVKYLPEMVGVEGQSPVVGRHS